MISDTEGIAPITIFCAAAPWNIEADHKGTPINPLSAIGRKLSVADENDIGAHRGRMPGIETAQLKIQLDHTRRDSVPLATRYPELPESRQSLNRCFPDLAAPY